MRISKQELNKLNGFDADLDARTHFFNLLAKKYSFDPKKYGIDSETGGVLIFPPLS